MLGNCLIKHVIEGNTEEMRRGERGLQQLLDFIKERNKRFEFEWGSARSPILEEAMDLPPNILRNDDNSEC